MPSDYFAEYENEINKDTLYYLTLDRESLNEVLNCLSSKDRIDVLIGESGEVSFDIPKDSDINVRSINIPDIMMGVLVDIEKEQQTYEEDSVEFNKLETTKEGIMFAIDLTKTILQEVRLEDENVLEQENEDES